MLKERGKEIGSVNYLNLSFITFSHFFLSNVLSLQVFYLWTSIPIIDFRNWRSPCTWICPEETNAFMRFVDRVLSFRQDVHSPSIKKFCLYFHTYFNASLVNEWISTVLRYKVEEIALIDRKDIMFPPSLFNCESLTMLEIEQSFLELPESVNFPNLKILRLSVILKNEHLIQKLLFNSPILEELSLEVNCNWDIQCLRIYGSNLKRLFINGLLYRNFDIQINAANLQSFKFSLVLAKDFVLHNFLTLLDAEIVLSRPAACGEKGELGHLATKLFSSLSNVKLLRISEYTLKLLSYQHHFPRELPSCYNLIHLEVCSASFHFGHGCHYEGNLPCWIVTILLTFLQVSPNLESLIFVEGFLNYESNKDDGWSLDSIPECLLLHLKSIEFRGFSWKQIEKDLVKLFLKNAKVLQSVRIAISGQSFLSWTSNYRKEVLDEIASFPRGSAKCVLHVS